jgi:hypothetical protein
MSDDQQLTLVRDNQTCLRAHKAMVSIHTKTAPPRQKPLASAFIAIARQLSGLISGETTTALTVPSTSQFLPESNTTSCAIFPYLRVLRAGRGQTYPLVYSRLEYLAASVWLQFFRQTGL